jgi:hypothetical protein
MRSAFTRINDVGGNVIIGNSGSGYTLINSNAINIGDFLTGSGYVIIGGSANSTAAYIVLGSVNLGGNYIRGKEIYMNTDGTGNTAIGNYTGSISTYAANTYIRTSVLYVNSQSDLTGYSRIQLSNYGTYIFTDLNGYDQHRYRFFLRNANNFEMNYNYAGGGDFKARFGFTGNQALGDFAEMFEWEDQNPEKKNRVGYTVVVNEQGYIRKATIEDNPNDVIGVVTATATVTGSAACMEWSKKYLRDDFEQIILDVSGNATINPDWDESSTYKNRSERPEWAPIGICGKLIVRNESPINPKWRLIGTRQTARIYLS